MPSDFKMGAKLFSNINKKAGNYKSLSYMNAVQIETWCYKANPEDAFISKGKSQGEKEKEQKKSLHNIVQ